MYPWGEFEEMEREMNNMVDQFNYISKNSPKELIREYETPEGAKVREVGPIVYGYSMTIGPDGKPKVTEFGNIKHPAKKGLGNSRSTSTGFNMGPQITAEREPLADVSVTDNEVKVVIEMPGVKKDNIKINARDREVEVLSNAETKLQHILSKIKLFYNNIVWEGISIGYGKYLLDQKKSENEYI